MNEFELFMKYLAIIGFIPIQHDNVVGFSTVGCYWNDLGTAMSDLNIDFTNLSTVECMEYCLAQNANYTFAGTQTTPPHCSCAFKTNPPSTALVQDGECVFPCPMTKTTLCGGRTRMAVYDITGETIPIQLNIVPSTQIQISTNTLPPLTNVKTTDLCTSDQFTSTYTKNHQTTTESTPLPETTERSLETTTQGSTSSSVTINHNEQTNTNCSCPCGKWSHLYGLDITRAELEVILEDDVRAIKKELTIDVKTVSSYKNRKISAPDDRTSSSMIGYLGAIIMCVPLVLIILSDICHVRPRK